MKHHAAPNMEALIHSYTELLKTIEDFTCLLADYPTYTHVPSCSIRPQTPRVQLCGKALTVQTLGYDLTSVYQAIEAGDEGSVLVIDGQGAEAFAFFGETATRAAKAKGIKGALIDGCFRDRCGIETLEFPIWARGSVPRPAPRTGNGDANCVVNCGGAPVKPCDIVVADHNGIVIVPQEKAQDLLGRIKESIR